MKSAMKYQIMRKIIVIKLLKICYINNLSSLPFNIFSF